MKYLGVSLDNKYVFTSKGFYVCEGKGKFIPYGKKMIPHLFEAARSNNKFKYRQGLISLSEYKAQPKKIVYEFFKNADPKNLKTVLVEWDKNFGNSLNLLSENDNRLLVEQKIKESWLAAEQLILEWGEWLSNAAGQLWSGVKDVGNKVVSGVKTVGNAVVSGAKWLGNKALEGLNAVAQKIIIPIIQQGVIPLMRWIRRNLNSYMGIIVDVIVSFTPGVAVMKVIWMLIVVLDCYEIGSGNYDPQDPERKEMPFVFLTIDLISLLLTRAAAAPVSAGLKIVAKRKAAQLGPGIIKTTLTKLLQAMPKLKSFLGLVKNFLTKVFGAGASKVVSSVFGFFDNVITKFITWIQSLVGATAKKATIGKLATGTVIGVTLAEFFKESTLNLGDKGPQVKLCQKSLIDYSNPNLPPEIRVPGLKYKGPANGVYDQKTMDAVKIVQKQLSKTDPSIKVTGALDPKTAFALGVKLDPTRFERFIGEKNMEKLGKAMVKYNGWIESLVKKGVIKK